MVLIQSSKKLILSVSKNDDNLKIEISPKKAIIEREIIQKEKTEKQKFEITQKTFSISDEIKEQNSIFPSESFKMNYSINVKNFKLFEQEIVAELLTQEKQDLRQIQFKIIDIIEPYMRFFEPSSCNDPSRFVINFILELISKTFKEIRDLLLDGEKEGYKFEVKEIS